jgi:stalled ribosome rescue protein Dom34
MQDNYLCGAIHDYIAKRDKKEFLISIFDKYIDICENSLKSSNSSSTFMFELMAHKASVFLKTVINALNCDLQTSVPDIYKATFPSTSSVEEFLKNNWIEKLKTKREYLKELSNLEKELCMIADEDPYLAADVAHFRRRVKKAFKRK